MEDRVVRRPEVLRMIGVSRSSLFAMEANGSFPRAMQLGSQARGWMLSAVQGWLASRPNFHAIAPESPEPETMPGLRTAIQEWEDELDALGPFAPTADLRAHLERAPGPGEMVTFLRGFLAARQVDSK